MPPVCQDKRLGPLTHSEPGVQPDLLVLQQTLRRAERPVGLSSITPYGSPQPFRRNTSAELINAPCPIAMGNHARVRHAVAERVLSFLDVSWVDARRQQPRMRTSPGPGVGSDISPTVSTSRAEPLPFIPSCSHVMTSSFEH